MFLLALMGKKIQSQLALGVFHIQFDFSTYFVLSLGALIYGPKSGEREIKNALNVPNHLCYQLVLLDSWNQRPACIPIFTFHGPFFRDEKWCFVPN